jgi:glycosyltransferase involved in cell wall biosynthesis
MRLAYLTTEYPKVSHTFIRREIRQLERTGDEVVRLAIRDSAGAIADPVDAEENERTFHCLACSPLRLLWDATVVKLRHPLRWMRAALMLWRMSRRSDRGVLRHIAYLIEAACLLRYVKRQGVEHLHVHFGTNAAAVARVMRVLGGPTYSFTVHGPDEFDAPIGFSLRGKIADAAFVVAITDYCAAQLRRWARLEDWDKISIVHCTVADEFFDEARPIDEDSRSLVCVGRLSAQKGHLVLLDAVRALRDDGVDLQLVLAGDGELRDVIEQRIDELDLAGRVTITGWISEAEVRRHLLAARALVLPSFAEGLPVVIMEALALGRPVVATRITGIPELVRDGENGRLVTASNVRELTEALRWIMEAPVEQLDEMGRAGRQLARERHSVEGEVARLRALFTGAVRGGGEG